MVDDPEEILYFHAKSDLHRGTVPGGSQVTRENPGCGDLVTVSVTFESSGAVTEAKFQGKGCVVSQAAASLVMEAIQGQTVHQAQITLEHYLTALRGTVDTDFPKTLAPLEGIRRFPSRRVCAELAAECALEILKPSRS